MRLLVVSEGKNELRLDGDEGALPVLVRRLIDRQVEISCRKVSDPAVHVHRKAGVGDGMFKRALSWLRYGENNGFDAVVLVVDNDNKTDRKSPLQKAQAEVAMAIPRAIGLAYESFDAWMLADEMAWRSVLGIVVQRQPDPEDLGDPKSACLELCAGRKGLSDLYASLASVIKLDVLGQRCPTGFRPFAEHVRSIGRC